MEFAKIPQLIQQLMENICHPCDQYLYDYQTIYSECQQYGRICRIQHINQSPFGTLIGLMRTAKSDALKSQSQIEIAGEKLPIEWISDTPVAVAVPGLADSLQSPPNHQSPENILNRLTDGCLRTIFASSLLSLDDLCSAGSVCRRFNTIATQVFAAKYGDQAKYPECLQSDALWKMEEFFRIAPNASIDYLDFDRRNAAPITGMIVKYCRNVKKLQFNCAHEQSILELQPMFDDLTHLTLWYARHDLTDTFTSNASLEYLKVSGMTAPFRLPNVHLPRLTKLELYYAAAAETSIVEFLRLNPQLKSLAIDNLGLERALTHLPNLEELHVVSRVESSDDIDLSRFEFAAFGQLKQLKTLTIRGCTEVMSLLLRALFHAQVPLECLVLDMSEVDKVYLMTRLIGQLNAVKCLKIAHIDGETLHELAGCFGNFAEIEVFTKHLRFEHLRNALHEIERPTAVTFRLYDVGRHLLDLDAGVADEIDQIRTAREIDLEVIAEVGPMNDSDGPNMVGFNTIIRMNALFCSICRNIIYLFHKFAYFSFIKKSAETLKKHGDWLFIQDKSTSRWYSSVREY